MTCEEALAHPWMEAFESGELETKNLSKEKMKKFLARQKWKVFPQHSTSVFIFQVVVLILFHVPEFRLFFLLNRKRVRPCWPWNEWLYCLKVTALYLLPALQRVRRSHSEPLQPPGFNCNVWRCCGSPSFINILSPLPFVPDSPLTPEAEHALQSLEHKMQGPPRFTRSLEDLTVSPGSGARLSCHLTGIHCFVAEHRLKGAICKIWPQYLCSYKTFKTWSLYLHIS